MIDAGNVDQDVDQDVDMPDYDKNLDLDAGIPIDQY